MTTVYFRADDGVHGLELFKLNPDTHVVSLVADINPTGDSAPGGSGQNEFISFNGALYFEANDGTSGRELWVLKSDGTTALVADINPSAGSSDPTQFAVFNNTLYFQTQADGNVHGGELWKVDTSGQASLVDDINVGTSGSFPEKFFAYNGALYFWADDGVTGRELWRITAGGTVEQAADINPGAGQSTPSGSASSNFILFNGEMYFNANDGVHGSELWKVDAGGHASMVADINTGPNPSSPIGFTIFNNELYFQASDNTHGSELFKLTTGGSVQLVADIRTDPSVSAGSSPSQLTVVNNELYFVALDGDPIDGTHGNEVWKVTAGGVASLVADIRPGSFGSSSTGLIAFRGELYFAASDGTSQQSGNHGNELYEIKANGSVVLHDLNTHVIGSGSSAIAVSSNPTGFTIADNQLFFSANDGNGTGIWEVGTNGAIFKTPESLTIGPFTAVQDTSAANTVLFNGFDF